MRHGKQGEHGFIRAKTAVAALALILCSAIGGTVAYLAVSADAVSNTFDAAQVQCVVTDDWANHRKTNITVTNPADDKNVDAYVRVTLVPSWEDADGNAVAKTAEIVYPQPSADWFAGNDGYYYYCKPLKVGNSTSALFNSEIVVQTDSVYTLNLQVLAEAIQAEGMDGSLHPVETVWKEAAVTADGRLVPAA